MMNNWELIAYCKALRTYATKKYGAYWTDSYEYETVKDEFDKWLDGKDDDKAYMNVDYSTYCEVVKHLPTTTSKRPPIQELNDMLDRLYKRNKW